MKKIFYLFIFLFLTLTFLPNQTQAATVKKTAPKIWSATTPEGFTPITWVKANGVASFFKAQKGNGYLDYLTIIYLPYNEIKLIASSTPQTVWGEPKSPFLSTEVNNWAFAKMATEAAKTKNPDAQFVWNMPFFNVNGTTTDLSLALKSRENNNGYITSGSRPENDILQNRRMLIIDNKSYTAQIQNFNKELFLTNGDQAVEGFDPAVVVKGDSTARLFVGVKPNGKELVIYCSRGAYLEDAVNALVSAGVPIENQMQADGGLSATCAYNLPGQYLVEPGRTLPHLMGAYSFLFKGTINNNGINVREGPGTKFKSIAKLAKGTPVVAWEEKNGWVRIDHSSQWIMKNLIKQN